MDQPSGLAVVEDAVRRELDAQERRTDAADTRAGLLLGFAGLVASVGPGDVWPPLGVAVRLLAGLAALVAVTALTTLDRSRVDVTVLRERLLHASPARARIVPAGHRHRRDAARRASAHAQLARLRLASGLLIAALALAITGATVEIVV